jgi:hypothetical protein
MKNMTSIFGFALLFWAGIFSHYTTQHFGYNFLPSSTNEFICDFTILLLAVAGLYMIRLNRR